MLCSSKPAVGCGGVRIGGNVGTIVGSGVGAALGSDEGAPDGKGEGSELWRGVGGGSISGAAYEPFPVPVATMFETSAPPENDMGYDFRSPNVAVGACVGTRKSCSV